MEKAVLALVEALLLTGEVLTLILFEELLFWIALGDSTFVTVSFLT